MTKWGVALVAANRPGTKQAITIRLHHRDVVTLREATRAYGGLGSFLGVLAATLRAASTAPAPSRPRREPGPRVAEAVAELAKRYDLPPPPVPEVVEGHGAVTEPAPGVDEGGKQA